MKTLIIIFMAICLSYSVKGQDCDFEAYKNELVELGGTYLKDFQIESKATDKKKIYTFSMILSKNTRYLFSCKSNEIIYFSLTKQDFSSSSKNNKNKKSMLLILSLADQQTDSTGKPVFFEYIPNETGAYHLEILGENKNFCAVAMVSWLGTINPNNVVDTSKIYELVDQQASFQNADLDYFKNYVSWNFNVDLKKKLKNFSGKMYVEFIIGTTGNIEKLEIIKSCGKLEFDQEVIKIIKASPAWKPAKIKGVNVKQKFIMDLQIKL